MHPWKQVHTIAKNPIDTTVNQISAVQTLAWVDVHEACETFGGPESKHLENEPQNLFSGFDVIWQHMWGWLDHAQPRVP